MIEHNCFTYVPNRAVLKKLRQHAKLRITGRQLKQPNIRKTMLLKNIAFLVRSDRGWVCQNLGFWGVKKCQFTWYPWSKLWACHCLIIRCKVRARQNGEQMRSFVAIVVTWFFISDILILAAQVLWESLTFRSIQGFQKKSLKLMGANLWKQLLLLWPVPLPKNKAILHQGLPSSLENSTYVHRYTSSRASSYTHRYRYNIYIYHILYMCIYMYCNDIYVYN